MKIAGFKGKRWDAKEARVRARETELQAARNALLDAQADGLTAAQQKPYRDAVKAAKKARDEQQ